MKLYEKEAIEFAKKLSFPSAKYMYDWDGYEVYSPCSESGKIGFYGPMALIIVNDRTNGRFITMEECEAIKEYRRKEKSIS